MVYVKPKRPLSPVPHLQATINEILNAGDEAALTKTLEHFDAPHRFERPDERNLIHWYKLLNYFDQLLERYVTDRDIVAKSFKSSADPSGAAIRRQGNSSPVFRIPHEDDLVRGASGSGLTSRSGTTSGGPSSPVVDDSGASQGSAAAKLSFSPSPALILTILRVTQRLIRNASHDTRYIYNSVEHLCALLADENSAITLLTLEILNMLLQRSPKLRAARTPLTPDLTERLMELAAGWGGRENGLGLLDCCSSNATHPVSADGQRMVFKYIKTSSSSRNEQGGETSSDRERVATHADIAGRGSLLSSTLGIRLDSCAAIPLSPSKGDVFVTRQDLPSISTIGRTTTIQIEDVGRFKGDERWLLADFASKNHVPRSSLFALLSSFRRAKRFCAGREGRIEATIIRLYAITTLFSIQPHPISLHDLLTKEPELLQDVVALARAEQKNGISDIPQSLRVIAIRCLTAMSCDRQTHSSVMNVTEVNLHHGALPTLLRTEIAALLSSCSEMNDSDAGGAVSTGMKFDTRVNTEDDRENTCDHGSSDASFDLLAECNRVPAAVQRIHLTESLLGLVYSLAMAPRSDGATPLANSGVLGILIPLLKDRDIRHSRVVAKAIRAMQGIIDGSSQSGGRQLFRDQDGLSLIAERIAVEVDIGESDPPDAEQRQIDEAVETEALKRRGESRALYQQLGVQQMTPEEALQHQPPSSSATSRGQLPQSKWALLRSLLQLLLVALGTGGNEVRSLVVESKLPRALRKIMAQPFTHGGSLFQSAATVTTDIAHAEPTATPDLVKAGIASTVLHSIEQGLPPCGEAVRCIPNLLAALCLAQGARDVIVSSRPLKQYLLRLATPFYTRALHGDIPIYIGSTLDELMRHVEALRPNGNEAMVEYLRMSAKFVNTETKGFMRPGMSEPSRSGEEMDDGRAAASKRLRSPLSRETGDLDHPEGDGERVSSDETLLDKMKLAVANNSCRLAGFAQGSSEHQEGIVKGGGLDEMIELRNAPALACPEASVRDGYMFSRHYPNPSMTVVSLWTSLRNLSARHGAAVLQSVFNVITNDAALVLKLAKDLDDLWLPEEENEFDMTKLTADKEERSKIRTSLSRAVRKLRVDVVLLSGLSRGGPGSLGGAWENAGGSHVASVIATVERAARFHLAKVYTGLTLRPSSDGDLNTARVTATGNPTMKSLQPHRADELLRELNKAIGFPLTKSKPFEEACKRYEVPPEGSESVRQNVKGLAWHLVTFAVATQRLYSTLARGLTFNPRRPSRDPARYAASAKCLAATMGRIFALHLKAATPLWKMTVKTMESERVVAAWDFVRGVLIEMKGAFFDENHRVTQSLVLKYFLEAGGAEALNIAIRPVDLVHAASMTSTAPDQQTGSKDESMHEKLETVLQNNTFSIACSLLAASDAASHLKLGRRLETSRVSGSLEEKDDDTTMSSDSISKQVHAIARIAVSDSASGENTLSPGEQFRRLLGDKNFITKLRGQITATSRMLLVHCLGASVRRIAFDVWNTCCGFLQLLGACPGLGASHGAPDSSRLLGQNQEWTSEDVQRSALSVSVHLMTAVTEQPQRLLAAFRPESPAMMDILGVIHSTSHVSSELNKILQQEQGEEPDDNNQGSEPQQEQPSVDLRSVDSDMVNSLTEMGFPEHRVRRALRRTGSRGIESAMDWLLSNQEDDDDSDDSVEEPEDSQGGERNGEDTPDDEGEEDQAENLANDGEAVDDSVEGSASRDSDEEGDGVSDDASEDHGPSSSVADDQVMVDAAETEEDVERPTEENRPSASNDAREHSGIRTSRACSEEDRSEGSGSISAKSAPAVSIEQDGKKLLDHSVVMELKALASALEASDEVSGEEVSQLQNMAAGRIGSTEAQTNSKEDSRRSMDTKPVSVAFFKEGKIRFFTSLLALTRAIIKNAGTHVHGVHLPYIAVELLSILQKDGSLLEEDGASFSSLLTEGLELALTKLDIDDHDANRHTRSSSVALWAHYGGYRSRKALRESGAFRLAFESLHRSMDEWEHSISASRLLDSEGSHPIKKLSINEEQCENENDTGKDITPASRRQGPASVARPMRYPTEVEASLLKRMTTCLLLLDADVRYQLKDLIIATSEDVSKSKQKKESNTPEGKQNEKMDTDDQQTDNVVTSNGEEPSAQASAQDSTPNDERALVQNLVDEHMREIFGAGAMSMDIDDKTSNGKDRKMGEQDELKTEIREEDVNTAKATALNKKSEAIISAKERIAGLLVSETSKTSEEMTSKETLVSYCLRILRQWKTVEVGDAILAVLQLLGSLTKDWNLADLAHRAHIVDLLLDMPHLDRKSTMSTDVTAVRFLTKTILRHIIEDPETLREAMEAEIRALTKSRPSFTTKSLIAAAAPLAARDLQAFVSAAGNAVKACDSSRGSHLQSHEPKATTVDMVKVIDSRRNVKDVVLGLSRLLVKKDSGKVASPKSNTTTKEHNRGLPLFALESIAEIVEVSHAAAVAFVRTPSPSSEISGSAMDFVVQVMLPQTKVGGSNRPLSLGPRPTSDLEEPASSVRKLFLALCSVCGNAQEEAVVALAHAAELEAAKERVSPGLIFGIAQCIAQDVRLRVLRAILKSRLANDLARSLEKLDMSPEANSEVASSVLKALALIGQAASHIARHSDSGDDISFASSECDNWFSLRDREDALPSSASYMVL